MAKDDAWRRFRDREDEEKEEGTSLAEKRGQTVQKPVGAGKPGSTGTLTTDKIDEIISRAEPMIEQLSNLYNMYLSGAERFPPNERRKQLDALMTHLQLASKPTQAIAFKCNTLMQHYNSNKERWDRLLKDLENGKIKRVAGPKRG